MTKTQRTEPLNAQEVQAPVVAMPVYQAPAPQQKTIERRGARSEPYVHHMPQIRGGICEWCGVLDSNAPASVQYQLCPHFRGMGEMRCSYCDDSVDPTEVITHAVLNIADHPFNPGQLVVWCNRYECSRKHEARFRVSR